MADKFTKDPFEDEVEDVFSKERYEEKTIICPQCGGKVKPGSQYCTYCGSKLETVDEEQPKIEEKIEEAPAKPKKPRYDANHRLIREDGDETPKEFVSSKDYKYGDGKGHSLSTLSLYNLGFAFVCPIIPFIIGMIGLSTKNTKDKKMFKISIVVNILITIVEIILIYFKATGKID